MMRKVIPLTCLVLLALLSPALAQVKQLEDYRLYFKPPTTAPEFWKALTFEIELGAYQVAAEFLQGFMEKAEDKDILEIEAKQGMSSFLRLRNIARWSDDPKVNNDARKNTEDLIEKASKALKEQLADPQRLAKLIEGLSGTRGERVYAIAELRRSGAVAVPVLVKEMNEAVADDQDKFTAIASAIPSFSREMMPGFLAALDIDNPIMKAGIVDGLRRRTDLLQMQAQFDQNPTPHLWHLAASPRHPDYLRKLASEALGLLLQTHPDQLPPARTELTRAANGYYHHRVRFADPKSVTLWKWDGKELVSEAANASRAEEHYGLRFAQQALDLDPTYLPAQVAALSIAVEKGLESAGLEQPLAKAPKVKEILTTVNPDLVVVTLDRAMDERHTTVVLGAVRALGDLQAVAAKIPKEGGQPAIARALNYPDRRVQLAAADALLKIPGPPLVLGVTRTVEILRRTVEADPVSKVLIADLNMDRGLEVAKAVKEAGYEPVVVQTGRQVLDRLRQAADIDAVLVDYQVPNPALRELVAFLRADVDTAQIPLLITIPPLPVGQRPPDAVIPLERMIQPYRNISLITTTIDPEVLKPLLTERIATALGTPWTPEERKAASAEAMVWLRRLAVGEVPGYSVKPAESAILKALRNEELAVLAVEAAGRLSGRQAQRELAGLVLDDSVRAEVRTAAANELARSIQANRAVLFGNQAKGLENLFATTEDRLLKANVGLVLGALRPDGYRTGDRLKAFVPEPPGEKPEPAMKEKEKEKEKDKE